MTGKLYTEQYRRLNAQLHVELAHFGVTARQYIDRIRSIAKDNAVNAILDYGCGKRDVWMRLHDEFDVREYDPALPGMDQPPEPAEFVVCIDVLEHIEPECLDGVLEDLVRVTGRVGLFTISTQPSGKSLPDGTNCHRIIQPSEWWTAQLQQRFRIVKTEPLIGGLLMVVGPRK